MTWYQWSYDSQNELDHALKTGEVCSLGFNHKTAGN